MVSAVVMSGSRGGVVGLLAGLSVALMAALTKSRRISGLALPVLIAAMAALLLGWFGMEHAAGRYAELLEHDPIDAGRIPLWLRSVRLAADFPWFGSGYGTFRLVEPLNRGTESMPQNFFHAHNEYVEALLEGGILRLVLTIVALTFVFRYALRAARSRDIWTRALGLGGLWSFSAIVLHSFFEFAIHLPAVTLLATVLAAQLAGLGRGLDAKRGHDGNGKASISRWLGVSVGFITMLALAALLYRQHWNAHIAEQYSIAAAISAQEDPPAYDSALAFQHACVKRNPSDPLSHRELGELYFMKYTAARAKQRVESRVIPVTTVVGAKPGLFCTAGLLTASEFAKQWSERGLQQLQKEVLIPAIHAHLRARNLCILLKSPHVRIAAHRDKLERADSRSKYLARARATLQGDAELWFVCGLCELEDKHVDEATACLRRSLEISDKLLERVIERVHKKLPADIVAEKVLPQRPALLLRAAKHLYPTDLKKGQLFLQRALLAFGKDSSGMDAEDWYSKAVIHRVLEENDEALGSYRKALARNPRAYQWRYEYAQLLYEQGKPEEALREASKVVAASRLGEAIELEKEISKYLATRN